MNYPDLLLAPLRVKIKAQSFGIHDFCAAEPEASCRPCVHLVRMAYDCFYGHLDSQEAVDACIQLDLRKAS